MADLEAILAECPGSAFQSRLREELERKARQMSPQLTTGVPIGFTTVTPYVSVVDVERLIAFAKEAFGAVEEHRTSGSAGGAFCILRIADSKLMFTGGPAVKDRPKLNAFHIRVPDTDAVYQRAIEAGGESLYPPADMPYGDREAGVKDPAGNMWFIARQAGSRVEGVRTVTPYLLANDASGLIEFLTQAFSARREGEAVTSPEGKLMCAMLWIGDAALEFGESAPLPFAFYLYVPDADALYQQAVAAGAKSLYPPSNQPYGDRAGGVEDPWGNTWYIATHLGSGAR